jgi:hypothetical protein
VAVRILALALVIAQVVARGKRLFNGHFEHSCQLSAVSHQQRIAGAAEPFILAVPATLRLFGSAFPSLTSSRLQLAIWRMCVG